MERTKKIRWRNKSGTFRMRNGNKIVKPNEVFKASVDEIPEGFRDVIVPVDETPEEVTQNESELPPEEVNKPTYTIQGKAGGWYDIVDASGNTVNTHSLRYEQANQFKDELEST